MAVSRLEIARLRCIASAAIELDAGRNLIVGRNGAGKTSVLEAVHVLGRGHSFRVRDNRRLIQRGEQGFLVRGVFERGHRPAQIGVEYRHGELAVHVDGVAGRRASELAAVLPVEVIDPGSHRLIDGSPGERRRFLDLGLFHVEHGYMAAWRAYRRVLAQRNEGLRSGASDAELAVWDQAFVAAAAGLDRMREAFVAAWGRHAAAIGERLLGEAPVLRYRSGGGKDRSLAEALVAGRERERARGLTLVGPHRSELVVEFTGARAREVASRGQQKLLAAALILGRVVDRLERGRAGGIVLVDDPAAELDERSLAAVAREVAELPVQMLVTGIRSDALAGFEPARVFHVEQGVIEPV